MALRVLGKGVAALSAPQEFRFEGEHVAMRGGRDKEWNDKTLDHADSSRRMESDPGWILEVLAGASSPPSTQRATGDRFVAACEFLVAADGIAACLPTPLGERLLEDASRAPDTPLCLQVHLQPNGIPTLIALRFPTQARATRPEWDVVEFTSFGVDIRAADVWSLWEAAQRQTAEPYRSDEPTR
jgi:hypothetical protein